MKEKRVKKGFTLAEVLITLTILGVVAAIVIPTMMNNQGEAAKRTKMKKAIASYEKVVETMRLTEGYTTVEAMKKDLDDNCSKSITYFKTKTVDSENNCIFQTSDGLWWNIKNIAQPIVAFEKGDGNKYINDSTYADKALKDDDAESKKAFYLTVTQGTPEQGYAFIVNDPSGLANKALAYAKLAEAKVIEEEKEPTLEDIRGWANNMCTGEKSKCKMLICFNGEEDYEAASCGPGYEAIGTTIYDGNGNVIVSTPWDAECHGPVDYCREIGYSLCDSDNRCMDEWTISDWGYDPSDFFDADGYNSLGYDKDGYNKQGWSADGINKITKTKYDKDGYDKDGYNSSGYDKEGYDKNGWNSAGKNKYTGTNLDDNGYDKNGVCHWQEEMLISCEDDDDMDTCTWDYVDMCGM